MDDIFITAAQEYKKLLNIQYNFVIGYKRKEYQLQITFDEYEFHHLAGLQYLRDIFYIRRTSRSEIFKKLCQGSIDKDFLSQSSEYDKILNRINTVADLENFLDNSEIIYKFNKSVNPQSLISADYILKGTANNTNTYFFIQKRANGKYFGKSIFPQSNEEKDYTRGHTAYTLLYKEKTNLITNEKQILYVRPSYQKQLSSQPQQQDNNNIKQIKFDSPVTAHNVRIGNGAGEITADPPIPNSFKNMLEKIKIGLSKIFKPKDKPSPPTMTVQTEEVPIIPEEVTAAPKEAAPEAEELPYVKLKIKIVTPSVEQIPLKEHKQTLRELESRAHEKYMKMQKDKVNNAEPPERDKKSYSER